MDNHIDSKVKDFVEFQVQRRISSLTKNFLVLVEQIRDKNYNVTEESYAKFRKAILDNSGDVSREVNDLFDKVNVTLK